MYQAKFWKGESVRHHGREDKIRGNPEAPPMHDGPGAGDEDDMDGADEPNPARLSQPKTRGQRWPSDEFPLRHAHVKPHRARQQVMMAHALRMHAGTGGTTEGTAVGGGAAGGGAGS